MNWKAFIALCCLFALFFTMAGAQDDEVMFNYQGRVKVNGQNFDGAGLFKFALISTNKNKTMWSNDGTSAGGSEPALSLPLPVNGGIFSVLIGDTSLGMDSLNPSVFNQGKVFLRTWFNDGVNGFQQLVPDRRIANPELLGIVSDTEDFTIYVNGTTGDDENNGLTTDTAKQTIQAAIDILPERLRCNVEIVVAAGVYNEQVNIFGINVEPGKRVTILGDTDWMPSGGGDPDRQITGADSGAPTTPLRDYCVYASSCSYITIQGFLMDYAVNDGIFIANGESFQVFNCKFVNNDRFGAYFATGTSSGAKNCIADNNGSYGFYQYSSSTGYNGEIYARGNGGSGIGVGNAAYASLHYTDGKLTGNTLSGLTVIHNAVAIFAPESAGEISGNSAYAVDIRYDSYVERVNNNSPLTGGINLMHGGHSYNP